MQRIEVVAQRGACARAPAVAARQRDDPVAQPVQLELAPEPEVHRCHVRHIEIDVARHVHDVERREHRRQCGDAHGELVRHTGLPQLVGPACEGLGIGGAQELRHRLVEHQCAGHELAHGLRDRQRLAPVAQEPARAALHEPSALEQHLQLRLGRDAVVEPFDLRPLRSIARDCFRRGRSPKSPSFRTGPT